MSWQIEKRLFIPVYAIGVLVTACALLGLIQIGSTTAFEDVVSLVIEGCFSSYLCVLIPLLYHRIRGNIREADEDGHVAFDPDSKVEGYTWGPWHIKGALGTAINAFAVLYLLLVGFFSFWPPTREVDAKSMNYSSLILGGIAILSVVYYLLWARKTYTGPIVEIMAG